MAAPVTGPTEPLPAPDLSLRIMTDLAVSQIPWWSEKLTVLPRRSRGGIFASVTGAWHVIRAARGYDVFISSNVRNALALGLFKRLTRRRRPLLMMTEMRLDDPRPDLLWKLKVALQRYAYAAVDAMCVSARKEATICAERVQAPFDRFRYIPWHTNVLEPRLCAPIGEYVFAAGRTGRDWRTLAEAARSVAAPFTVVCSQRDIETISFPSNVTTLTDIPYQRYRELLEGARIVVVPLEPHTYSTGQVVILEAMALGKPVVAARVLGTEDYIANGVDGILVTPGDAAELGAAISSVLSVAGLADGIGRAALNRVVRTHTLDQYVRNVIGVARDLAAGRRSSLSLEATEPGL